VPKAEIDFDRLSFLRKLKTFSIFYLRILYFCTYIHAGTGTDADTDTDTDNDNDNDNESDTESQETLTLTQTQIRTLHRHGDGLDTGTDPGMYRNTDTVFEDIESMK
jgi:hypothetical protein